MRGIYYYHTRVNGWRDIGYNFLIDRFGTIYEGRYGGVAKAVIGAQVLGFNSMSTGVSLIGTFDSVAPSKAALTSLERLLAWKLDLSHLNPLGTARAALPDHPEVPGRPVGQPAGRSPAIARSTTPTVPAPCCSACCRASARPSPASAIPRSTLRRPRRRAFSPNGDGVARHGVAARRPVGRRRLDDRA